MVLNSTGGLYGASVGAASSDPATHALGARVTVFAEKLSGFAGFGFADGLPFWLTVLTKPGSGVILSAVSPGGRLGFVAPGLDSVYDVSFCQPGAVEFDLAFDGPALSRTIFALLLGELVGNVPYVEKVDDFIAIARARVPLFDEATQHFLNAATAQSARTRRNEFSAGLRSIQALSAFKNASQLRDLLLAITDVGVKSTLSADLEALIKLNPTITLWQALRQLDIPLKVAQFGIKVASLPLAFEVLILQTGGNLTGPGPMVIRVRSQ